MVKKVPMLDLKAQYAPIREEVRRAMDKVCDDQHFILGPEVAALEEEVATFCGSRFGIGVSSGTDALLVALMALELKPGDEVITTAYSFFATAGVITRLGCRPVFVDIHPETFNVSAEAVLAKVTPKTKAIIPVHLFGRCASIDPLLSPARERGIRVVEDAAQAIGSFDSNRRQAGSQGALGCFSFFPSKNLGAFGDGGLVTTSDPELAEAVRILRVHGSKPKYYHRVVGGNFRLDALQAAILRVKLKQLPAWTQARRRNAERYRRMFAAEAGCEKLRLPKDEPGHIYNQFVVRVPDRDALKKHLLDHGVETEVYYPVPLHLQECFKTLGFKKGDFPVSEAAAQDSLALPIYPELTEEQQTQVVRSIGAFFQQAARVGRAA